MNKLQGMLCNRMYVHKTVKQKFITRTVCMALVYLLHLQSSEMYVCLYRAESIKYKVDFSWSLLYSGNIGHNT